MTEITTALFEAADIDEKIFELRNKLNRVPHQLSEARKELDIVKEQLDEFQNPWNDLQHQIDEKESTIKVALDTIEKFEAHMKRVNTQKEYIAAQKQVDEARKLNQKLQDEILENRMKQEELEPRMEEIKGRYNDLLSEYETKEQELLGNKSGWENEMHGQESQLKERVEKISGQMWTYYQRLVQGSKHPSIVKVVAGKCNGCNMTIPPQSYNLLIANPEKLHTCSHCNRIIYYKEEAPAPQQEEAPVAEVGTAS